MSDEREETHEMTLDIHRYNERIAAREEEVKFIQAHHGIHSCKRCGRDFPGPDGGRRYVEHRCKGE